VEAATTRSPFVCRVIGVLATSMRSAPRVTDCPSIKITPETDAAWMLCPSTVVAMSFGDGTLPT